MNENVAVLVKQLQAQPFDDVAALYLQLTTSARDKAHFAAFAMRQMARTGKLTDAAVPVLVRCLTVSPDRACTVHLAKALAAFGRKGQAATGELCTRIEGLRVNDDVDMEVLDGCLWSLGYVGGDKALALVKKLQGEKKSRVGGDGLMYEGRLDAGQRQAIYSKTLAGVTELVAKADAGLWRECRAPLKKAA